MKRKIIEVYAVENLEEDSISIEFEKVEDSEVANVAISVLLKAIAIFKDGEDELTVECGEE